MAVTELLINQYNLENIESIERPTVIKLNKNSNKSIYNCHVNPFNNTVIKGAAGVCIYTILDNNIYVLVGQEMNGEYNFALGKREEGETLIDTACRELHEEMGVCIKPEDLLTYSSCAEIQWTKGDMLINRDMNPIYHILLVYFVKLPYFISSKAFIDSIVDNDPLTMYDYKWIPLNDILKCQTKWLTLVNGEIIKMRRCLRSMLKLACKKNIFNIYK